MAFTKIDARFSFQSGTIFPSVQVVEPFFNLSAAEKDFFRLPTSEFHDRIYNQFEKIQRRVFNESLAGMEAEFSRLNTSDLKAENEVRSFHEKRPGYERREKTYRIPSKDGVRIVRKGKRNNYTLECEKFWLLSA